MPLKLTPFRNTSSVPRLAMRAETCAAGVDASAPENCLENFAHSLGCVACTNSARSSTSSRLATSNASVGRSRYIGLALKAAMMPLSAAFSLKWSWDFGMASLLRFAFQRGQFLQSLFQREGFFGALLFEAASVELVVFLLCQPVSHDLLHPPGVREHVALVELEEGVELFPPVPHVENFPPSRLVFRKIQIHCHDPVQFRDLLFLQVILGHGHIRLPHLRALPRRQSHVGFGVVGALGDDFPSGLA